MSVGNNRRVLTSEEESAGYWELFFGLHVKDLRKARGWSQEELANRMSAVGHPMHQTTVAKLESGSRPTNVGEVAALAAIFRLSIAALFDRSDDHMTRLKELAALAARLSAMAEERAKLTRRLAALDEEIESAQAEYGDLERRTAAKAGQANSAEG